jgi:hypothetical protein
MTVSADSTTEQPSRPSRARGRGWLLSFAAILTWAAVLTIVKLITQGPPDPHALYWFYGPMLATVTFFGTPLTYLVAWRRPRSYPAMVLWALPVFLVVLAFVQA